MGGARSIGPSIGPPFGPPFGPSIGPVGRQRPAVRYLPGGCPVFARWLSGYLSGIRRACVAFLWVVCRLVVGLLFAGLSSCRWRISLLNDLSVYLLGSCLESVFLLS